MKFYIITPTYNRPQELMRCLGSVLVQNFLDWEMIIVNDSPRYDYSIFEKNLATNPKIKYYKNEKNMGVNFSRNFVLDYINERSLKYNLKIKKEEAVNKNICSKYIIFLDDDDWLEANALQNMENILNIKNINWLITNRAKPEGASLSNIRKENISNFNLEFLLLRKSSGDVTHTIEKSIALSSRFSKKVKQGEEWIYFSNLNNPITYENINTTISNGYSDEGLNNYMSIQDKRYKIKNLCNLFLERLDSSSTLSSKILTLIYIFLRILKTLAVR